MQYEMSYVSKNNLMMTREIANLDMETFVRAVEQIRSFTATEWESWQIFVEEKYGIDRMTVTEMQQERGKV